MTRSPNDQIRESVDRPGLGDVQLLEEADGVAIGHAGDEVAGRGVERLRARWSWRRGTRSGRSRTFSHSPLRIPDAFLNSAVAIDVLVDRVEQKRSKAEHGVRARCRSCGSRSGRRPAFRSRRPSRACRSAPKTIAPSTATRSAGRSSAFSNPARVASSMSWLTYAMRSATRMICPSIGADRSARRHADRRARLPFRMLRDAVAHFPREVQAAAVVLQQIDDAQALLVVVEAARHQRVDHPLAGVSERRVAEIVAERDRLGQLLVQVQHLRDGARDLRDLERVRQPRPVVIAGRARRTPASCASAGGTPCSG